MMTTKLDINSLLSASIRSKGEVVQEGQESQDKFNIDLEASKASENEGNCEGCGDKFNLNLESVAFEERAQEFLGESTIANLRAAIASGIAVNTVLEARANSRAAA
jgi:hypothetical protein